MEGVFGEAEYLACCGSHKFAKEMAKAGPFYSPQQAISAATHIWFNQVDVSGWLEAFSAHPQIGQSPSNDHISPTSAQWSKGEQSTAIATATDSTLQELYDWNTRYAQKFGFVFLICASGRSTPEILGELKRRYSNRPLVEFEIAAQEQMKIIELRIKKLFSVAENTPTANTQFSTAGALTKAEVLDLFTIKLHHGGVMTENPRQYVGGNVDYVDRCNVDMMSMLEISSMLKEVGVVGTQIYYYKYPKTDWIKGVWNLESDSDVVEMCVLVPPSRLVLVFAVLLNPIVMLTPEENLTQEYNPSQDPNLEYVETDNDRAFFREMEDLYGENGELHESEDDGEHGENEDNGGFGDNEDNWGFGDIEDDGSEDEDYVVQQDEWSDDSFHSDSSNEDSTDEDVANYKTERAKKKAAKESAKASKGSTKASKGSAKNAQGAKAAADKGKQKEVDKNTNKEQDHMGAEGNVEGSAEGNVHYSSDSSHYIDIYRQ